MVEQCKYCGKKVTSAGQLVKHFINADHKPKLNNVNRQRLRHIGKRLSAESQDETDKKLLSRRTTLQLGVAGISTAAGLGISSTKVRGQQIGLTISDTIAGNLTSTDLAETLLPDDSNIDLINNSITYTGASEAAGTFTGRIRTSTTPDGGGESAFGFDDGIILGTGAVSDVEGPNNNSDTTTAFGTGGDTDLDQLTTGDTTDAAVLEFEFNVPDGAQSIRFNYLFGSEEYNKYVFSPFNDVFAFFLNGNNVARINGTPTAINNLNHGFDGNVDSSDNDAEADTPVNPTLYVNNDTENGNNVHGSVDPENPPGLGIGFDPDEDPAPYDTEMDGFSVELAIDAAVDPAENPQQIKLAVADVSDQQLDTCVLIEGASIEVDEQEDDGGDQDDDDGDDDGGDDGGDDSFGPTIFEVIEITDQTPDEIVIGESFRVQYIVENVGNATGRRPILLEVDGQRAGNKPDTLTPGQQVLNSFIDVTPPESVDPGDTVTLTVRTDENSKSKQVTVISADDTSGSRSVADYADERDVVGISGVNDAINDWQAGEIGVGLVSDVINAWQSGVPVA